MYDMVWRGRRALVRVDFNVPQDEAGNITDDTRIRAALPTIAWLQAQGASQVLMSHLGRPQAGTGTCCSLQPVAAHLSSLLGQPVPLITAIEAPESLARVRALAPGQILMLENTRFQPGETRNEAHLAQLYSQYGDVYVNDAFGSMHRAHASTAGVAAGLPAVAGLLVHRELTFLAPLLTNPRTPGVILMGGAKISDKIRVIHNLLQHMDTLLIGGGMANTFLKAQGHEVGDSLIEASALPLARQLLREEGHRIQVPIDVHIGRAAAPDTERRMVPADAIPAGWMALDIGEATIAHYANRLAGAATVFWNGPMGVSEIPPFDTGTTALAGCIAGLEDAVTIIGGGDSGAAVHRAGLAEAFSHVSTGGGACLEFLSGTPLPGLVALDPQDS